jgi:hypothetical protein
MISMGFPESKGDWSDWQRTGPPTIPAKGCQGSTPCNRAPPGWRPEARSYEPSHGQSVRCYSGSGSGSLGDFGGSGLGSPVSRTLS